ncbi:lanthionine synthetase C family protein [Actinoallomurus rhizosphaericola]|uniref:lanthionine synthetase C family protein n=1 Tax=Actinoallomurus rhizosphaericola TaxID=2952536 RepID=UPI002092B183|nr:lanthionine synthetase C family protein [Actinoallomurus rhizosphaericola]MCO5997871.1 lanthionine synthetase C family protein [Actinoallomurus rhizosphaericola]
MSAAPGRPAPDPGLLSGAHAERAAELIRLIAERLADPVTVAAVSAADRTPAHGGWAATGLARGHPGVAAFYGTLAWSDSRWAATAHAHLRRAVDAISSEPSAGLALGPAAVLSAVQTCGAREGDYGALRRNLLGAVAGRLRERLNAPAGAPGTAGVSGREHDLISGCTGVGRLLLDAVDDGTAAHPDTVPALRATLRRLVRLTEPIEVNGRTRPGWWTAASKGTPLPAEGSGDVFEVGVAHGVAGPLALLSLGLSRGHAVRGQADAIEAMAEWLVAQARRDAHGPYWPARTGDEQEPGEGGSRSTAAWCTGTAGVAAALHLAGVALDDAGRRSLAVEALRAVMQRSEEERRLVGPTVCHGHAGLIQALHRVGTAARDPALLAGARRMALRMMDEADEDAPFVFRHSVPDIEAGRVTRWTGVDAAGMYEGAAGCAAALLTVTPGHLLGSGRRGAGGDVAAWDRILLLS